MRRIWPRRRRADEMATCRETMRVLQSFLDGQTDEITAQRVGRHLEACRRCGLEAETYRHIKAALARHAPRVDRAAVERLRTFGATLAERHDGDDSGRAPA
jgi:anti-sigma factor RsiW